MHSNIVSIIIPTYNRAKVIGRAVDSIFTQTYKNWELIIVDDGSTDNTEASLAKYIADPRVSYHRIENGGAPRARNYGINLASGQVIALLDSDDEYTPARVEEQLLALSERVKFSICGRIILKDGVEQIQRREDVNRILCKRDIYGGEIGVSASLFMFKKELTKHIQFDINLPSAQDIDFALRALTVTNAYWVAEPLCKIHKTLTYGRISTDFSSKVQGFWLVICKICRGTYKLNFIEFFQMGSRFLIYLIKFFIVNLATNTPILRDVTRKFIARTWISQ